MVDPKASRFWQAALQSGLIDAEGLHACLAAILPEKRVDEQLDRRLAKQAVQQGRLTLWQAQQILAGKSNGFKINRYTLIEMIGQGGMGRVYLAKDTRLNRRVALKILSPERMNNPRAIARFQREARVGAQLQHENLVRIYDEGEANGKCYLVMEYIEGKNIGAMIAEDGPIPPTTAARLAQQVALGLEHAQLKGLIHRDVNPYNILVTRDGVAKLTDLGLAIDQSDQAQVTREGATVGTFDYVSPEQARHSHSVDTRSDIYSLGCTLYHMLSSQVPFPSPSLPEKLFGHQAVEPVSLTTLVPGLPEGLSEVVEKMMRKSPDDRYPTPLEVAQALDPYTDNPAGTLFPGPGSSGIRGLGRPSLTDTQVVDAPRVASGPAQAATQEATRLVEAAPPLFSTSTSSSSATRPSPVPDVAAASAKAAGVGPQPGPAKAVGDSTSRSNENWSDLGLGIDLGPQPSLTEGLQSGKKKSRTSSPEIAVAAPAAPVPVPVPAAAPPTLPAPPPVAPTLPHSVPVEAVRTAPPGTDGLAGLGLSLDLGPEPPLSTHKPARAKAKATPPKAAAAPSRSSTPRAPGRQPGRHWLIALGTLGGAAAVAGILFGFGLFGLDTPKGTGAGAGAGAGGSTGKSSSSAKTGAKRSKPARTGAKKQEAVALPADQLIAVEMPDHSVIAEQNLKSAMQRAIGSKGYVLLNNREPLKLTEKEAEITIGGGKLFIRAAPGVQPVLEVEIKGQNPFLSTRTDTPLTMVGVTIVARYSGKPKVVPAVIQAGANVTLDRCAFRATGAVKDSRAVVAEGSDLTVNGSWFEGFDTALDVASFGGSITRIQQSMMVRARTNDGPAGWALRVRRTPGGNTKTARRLVMEHCTVKGKGLLHLVDFSPEARFQAEIKECAVLTEALLAWETPKAGTPLTAEALDWRGEGNQFDVHGKAWVVLSPEGTPELADGPIDLASWRSKATEHDPVPPPIKFRVPPDSLSESPQPQDFAIIDPEIRPPGADPGRVGPTAPPVRP